ncbi:MAG: 7-carboxy-7-deazaguanine synthase [Acidimicrobiales bacterium]
MYRVKEIFYTLQGEGVRAGRPAVFCRFSGCNLWSGRERHRATAACRFCDTDFVGVDGPGGGRFPDADTLAEAVRSRWPSNASLDPRQRVAVPYVVCTGGEPLLQMDADLTAALHARGFEVAVETNGTKHVPPGVDWVCVSPKVGAEMVVRAGNEVKVVYPQEGLDLDLLASLDFEHRLLQPMDGPDRDDNTAAAVRYCLSNPQWRLSLQTHKLLGIP